MALEMDNSRIVNKVILLDDHTANRIAAGEVIERPFSVVKELVENSIDAGATRISITLENAGKDLIKIADDGCGMSRDDAVLALQRHATSKIYSSDDLNSIKTLGFRGEALPSIASVSIMEIISKVEESTTAVKLSVNAGAIEKLEHVASATGTTVIVRNLFFNTPARLKFLKTTQTELLHIIDIVSSLALANPNIKFKLVHNNKEIFTSAGTGEKFNTVIEIFGKDVARQLVKINFETPILKVDGFVSNQSINKLNRKHQIFFVNKRVIKSKTIIHAIDHAYKGLLPPGRYPVAIVYIDIEPELVDVNVHPTKAEVKFLKENDIHSAVYQAINNALMTGSVAPQITEIKTPVIADQKAEKGNDFRFNNPDIPQRALINPTEEELAQFKQVIKQKSENLELRKIDPFEWGKGRGVPVEESPVPEADASEIRTVSLSSVKLIGQAKNTFIIAECDDGIILIDQHIAHERVLYESFIKKKDEKKAIQMLIVPITISLGQKEYQVISKRIDDIEKSGFILENFGKNTFLLRGVPSEVNLKDAENVLKDIINEIVDISLEKHIVVKSDQVLITASCKMAVKAGDPLSFDELQKLLNDLLKCDNPFVCPHGRPIIVSLSNWELEKKFHRK